MAKEQNELPGFDAADIAYLPTAWQINPDNHPYGRATTALIEAEREVPVAVELDSTLRPKIVDDCGMTCTFCHNEGTPVAYDNREPAKVFVNIAGLSGRVSVFSETNGVDFLPGKMLPDASFIDAITSVRDGLGLNELHLTGGEPTLHPNLPGIIAIASQQGFTVKMTSNGENGARVIPACAEAGLSKINFSIFGTTPEELAEVQNIKYRKPLLAAAKIKALHRSIASAFENGVSASANVVMPDDSHGERIMRILDHFAPELSVRILNELDAGDKSHYAIYNLLANLGATPLSATVIAGCSSTRVRYALPNGREIQFKQIRPARMPETCGNCELNNPTDCKEGFYGVRLYVDQDSNYKVGVCLQRMDLTMAVSDFNGSAIQKDVEAMRQKEFRELRAFYAGRQQLQ